MSLSNTPKIILTTVSFALLLATSATQLTAAVAHIYANMSPAHQALVRDFADKTDDYRASPDKQAPEAKAKHTIAVEAYKAVLRGGITAAESEKAADEYRASKNST